MPDSLSILRLTMGLVGLCLALLLGGLSVPGDVGACSSSGPTAVSVAVPTPASGPSAPAVTRSPDVSPADPAPSCVPGGPGAVPLAVRTALSHEREGPLAGDVPTAPAPGPSRLARTGVRPSAASSLGPAPPTAPSVVGTPTRSVVLQL